MNNEQSSTFIIHCLLLTANFLLFVDTEVLDQINCQFLAIDCPLIIVARYQ